MRWTGQFVFYTLFLYPLNVWSTNPGFKGKITTKGIDYGCKIVMSVLRDRLLDVKIPDLSGKKHTNVLQQIQYNISRITISNVNFPDTSVTLISNLGLKVTVSIGYIEMNGNWHIKSNILRTHGGVKAQIYSVATSFYLKFGKNNTGRPNMFITDCTSYIAKLQMNVFGKYSWLYNLIMRWFEPSIRKYLSSKICLELKKILNEKIHPFLQKMPVTKIIGRYVGIDYSLTSPPVVTEDSLILPLKGEFYNLLHRTDIPFSAPALNFVSGHERMFYIGFSEYLFNSAGYVYNSVGGISFNITDDMLPDNSHIRFDTQTIGTLIPQMKNMYPIMKMKLHFVTDSAPSVAFVPGKIILTISGNIYAFAILPNSTSVPLFNVKQNAQITATVGIKDDKITGKLALDRGYINHPSDYKNYPIYKILEYIHNFHSYIPRYSTLQIIMPWGFIDFESQVELSLKKSNIGPFEVNCLQAGIDFLISIVILPRINSVLANGYSLPLIDQIKLSNIIVQPHKNFLLFATDITYN